MSTVQYVYSAVCSMSTGTVAPTLVGYSAVCVQCSMQYEYRNCRTYVSGLQCSMCTVQYVYSAVCSMSTGTVAPTLVGYSAVCVQCSMQYEYSAVCSMSTVVCRTVPSGDSSCGVDERA
jgi:hypothetical protein